VKRILVGAVGLASAFALAACSGGSSDAGSTTGGGAVAAGASSSAPATTTPAPTTSSSTPTPSSTPKTTPTPPKPAPPKPKPKPPVTTADVPCAKAAAASGTSACVDLSAHRAWLLEDGNVVYGPVSMLPGQKANPTPTGTFHVLSKEKMHYSREFDNAKMPNSVFFYPGDAFHTGSLKAYSHGCVHLSATSSLKFFNTLAVGDLVQVVP
jgi:lipoprotein-anchoring transpeptidase ErfK/SrfK